MEIVEITELINDKGEVPHCSSVGGYGITYIGRDHDDILCADCVNGWNEHGIVDNVTGGFVYWEGVMTYCDGCNCEIESEYGDPSEPDEL